MLKNNNNDKLQQEYNTEFIYFIQLWGELLDYRTIDIYQHNILNSFLAMQELLQVIDNTLAGIYTSQFNFDDCKNETAYLLENDDIIENVNPYIYNSLKNKLYAKADTKESKIALKAQLKSSIRIIGDNYIDEILKELKNNLQLNDIEKITKHTKMLISQCLHNGWSQKALMETTRFLASPEVSFDDNWGNFSHKLKNTLGISHHVYIELAIQTISSEKKLKVITELKDMGCQVKEKHEILDSYTGEDLDSLIHSEKIYLFIETTAPDVYSAASQALQAIANKIYLLSFYGFINFWNIGSSTIFVINPVSRYRKSFNADSLFKPYEYIDITNRVFEKTKEIFSSSNNNIIEKLSGAFAYTNISKASMFQEAKFINLWVALESLVRTGLYKDIITNLKEVVPAACTRRYIFSVIRNFIEDCNRCGVSLEFSDINIDIAQKQDAVEKMLSIMQSGTQYSELESKMNVNTLLFKRCKEVHALVTDYKLLRKKLENHHKMIKWQLQRLYRIRNGIAHSANNFNLSTMHIRHLFSYLTTTILEIVAIACENEFENIDEICCKIVDDYSCAIELLKNTRMNSTIQQTILKTGFIDLI